MEFTSVVKKTDAGAYTVEGNAAGTRAALMAKQREEQEKRYAEHQKRIKEDFERSTSFTIDRFESDKSVDKLRSFNVNCAADV